jgi:hypothetical protein
MAAASSLARVALIHSDIDGDLHLARALLGELRAIQARANAASRLVASCGTEEDAGGQNEAEELRSELARERASRAALLIEHETLAGCLR